MALNLHIHALDNYTRTFCRIIINLFMQYLSSDIVKHLRSNISRQIFFHACCVFINQTTQSIISQNPVCPSAPPLTYVLFNFYQNTPRNLLLITLSFLGDYNDVLILSEIRRIISFGGHSNSNSLLLRYSSYIYEQSLKVAYDDTK